MATGKGAEFWLEDSVGGTLTNISSYIRAISPTNEGEEVDGTVISSQKREYEATFERDRMVLRLKWSPAAMSFTLGVKGLIGLEYEYYPNGNAVGKPVITGTCNVLRAQSIPPADPNSLTEIEIELNINSEAHDEVPEPTP